MNGRLKRHIRQSNCTIIAGDRGAGKSCLLAFYADEFNKLGYKVYCQYPYKDCYRIPMVETNVNGVIRHNVDKNWLYTQDLSDSCILLDEGKNIWPSRSWNKWTQADDDFFDFIRKTNTVVIIATLAYDCLDLNIKRASDETIYLTKGFWHFSHCEASRTTVCKISDKNTEVVGRQFNKGMRKVLWDVCEVPLGDFLFWRKPFYNKYLTLYVADEKPQVEAELWDNEMFE